MLNQTKDGVEIFLALVREAILLERRTVFCVHHRPRLHSHLNTHYSRSDGRHAYEVVYIIIALAGQQGVSKSR